MQSKLSSPKFSYPNFDIFLQFLHYQSSKQTVKFKNKSLNNNLLKFRNFFSTETKSGSREQISYESFWVLNRKLENFCKKKLSYSRFLFFPNILLNESSFDFQFIFSLLINKKKEILLI
ncbi:hypothetical protein BpHYR1_018738 [Brachionus plicatilis]|uniref:Uncharacterized protein n=1 Tax=Brachionus plicatilis TaxID=10195 RepID=A0A3M7Q9D5_BRAPC|nr:hypothetical protein BpHYR1_018738 [Brachionus plicatilis]